MRIRRDRLARAVAAALAAVGASAGLVGGIVGGIGVAVAADGEQPSLVVRSVDTRTYEADRTTKLVVVAKGPQPAASEYQLEIERQLVQNLAVVPAADAKLDVGVVFVVDISKEMDTDGAADQVRNTVSTLISRRTPNERFGLVAAGVNSRVITELTSDEATLKNGLETLRPTSRSDSSLVDAVKTAGGLFERHATALQRNIIVVSASSQDASSSEARLVASELDETATMLFGAYLATADFNDARLSDLAKATNGTVLKATSTTELGTNLTQLMGHVRNQVVLSAVGPEKAKTLEMTVTARGAKANALVTTGTFVQGANVNPPVHKPLSRGPGFLQGDGGKWVAAFAALLGATLAAMAIGFVVFRDRTRLSDVLELYSDDGRRKLIEEDEPEGKSSIASTKFMQRAVALTNDLAQRRGVLTWVEKSLEQADLPLRAAEALLVYAVSSTLLVAALAIATHKLFLSLIALLLVLLAPPAALNFFANKRKRKFTAQLPDTLSLISGSLKAGYSLMQGLEAVSQEVGDPMGRELRRIVIETQLGRPVEEALEDSATRMNSPDFAWAVMAIRIQREVGGNLAELLTTVGETMVARERLGRDVRSLTAEGRMSAIVIGVLPVILGLAMWSLNPKYINVLFQERLGNFFLGLAVILMLFGFWWMKKTIEIEV